MKLSRAEFLRTAAAGAAIALSPGIARAQAPGPVLARKIPVSGETVPAIGLGTAQDFGAGRDGAAFAARVAVIKALLEGGGRVIDTAPSYGGAEAVIGRALAELGQRDKAFLSTKMTAPDQPAASLAALRTPKLELDMVHNLRDVDANLKALAAEKAAGRVRYIGVTTSFEGQHGRIVEIMQAHTLDWIQIDYALDNRDAERRILPTARDKGIAVMINLPFGRTRLFSKVRGKPLPDWAKDIGCASWAQVFLKFVLAHEAVTVAIPGTNNPAHMADNLGAMRGPLPDAALIKRMIAEVEAG
jgi:aryl-alcohol dehydrogenase-like predicted oxidoreductase